MKRLRIVPASTQDAEDLLGKIEPHRTLPWVVPKAAKVGDDVAVFHKGQGIIATGTVMTSPERDEFGRRTVYRSLVGNWRPLREPVTDTQMRTAVPHWAWLDSYSQSLVTPANDIAQELRKLIETSSSPSYWIVKARPSENDLAHSVQAGAVGSWRTARPPNAGRSVTACFCGRAVPGFVSWALP